VHNSLTTIEQCREKYAAAKRRELQGQIWFDEQKRTICFVVVSIFNLVVTSAIFFSTIDMRTNP
jgi:hypothetical protein